MHATLAHADGSFQALRLNAIRDLGAIGADCAGANLERGLEKQGLNSK